MEEGFEVQTEITQGHLRLVYAVTSGQRGVEGMTGVGLRGRTVTVVEVLQKVLTIPGV